MRHALDFVFLCVIGALLWLWYVQVLSPDLGGGMIGACAAVMWFIELMCPRQH